MTDHERLIALPDLEADLHRLVAQIPRGRVTTYGDLARALGDRRASLWVGFELRHHRHDASCPCHRVVRSDGNLGGYAGGDLGDKQQALRREGVACRAGKLKLDPYRFGDFVGPQPLVELRQWQVEITRRPPRSIAINGDRVAGIDVSYRQTDAVAAYVELRRNPTAIAHQSLYGGRVTFPYIPTFLSFRELPIVIELLEQVRVLGVVPDVLMVDGSGILHPHRAGVATMIGAVAQIPTVGVTKKPLYGCVDLRDFRFGQTRDVTDPESGETLGVAMLPTPESRKPLYVSPGYAVSVEFATQIVRSWLGARRLPEPIYWADRLSRRFLSLEMQQH